MADGRTKVGVVSDGELDGDNGAPVMVKAVQVRAERAVSVVAIAVHRGSTAIREFICGVFKSPDTTQNTTADE